MGRGARWFTESDPVPVALVVGRLGRGGAERLVVEIANGLDRERFRPLVVTTHDLGPLAGEIDEQVETLSLNRSGRAADPGAALRLARVFATRGVRIVHSHNHHASYFVWLARMLGRGDWLHVVHDHHGPSVGSRKLNILDRLLLRNVSLYIATSEALRQRAAEVVGLPPERIRLLYNGVAVPALRPSGNDTPATIIQVGRLNHVKNPLFAVEAAAILKRSGLEFRWLLVGAAEDAEIVEKLESRIAEEGLEDNVLVAGEVSNVHEVLARATVGVLTSRYEGLSVAVLEYMAAGLPVVLTEVGETSEVVRRSGCGFVVPQGSPVKLATGLSRILRDESLRARLGRKGWTYVGAHHTIRSMLRELMSLYDEVLGTDTATEPSGPRRQSNGFSRKEKGRRCSS